MAEAKENRDWDDIVAQEDDDAHEQNQEPPKQEAPVNHPQPNKPDEVAEEKDGNDEKVPKITRGF